MKPAQDSLTRQAAKPAAEMLHPYIPYLIAIAFIALTATLTLLLTLVLDNRINPEQATATQQTETPLPTDAREAFGNVDRSSHNTIESNSIMEETPDSATLPAEAAILLKATPPATKETPAQEPDSDPLLTEFSQHLDQIMVQHDARIKALHKMTLDRAHQQYRYIESIITQQLYVINTDINRLEERFRPGNEWALPAYKQMTHYGGEAFNRMMQQRETFLLKVEQSRQTLRQRYTQLLSDLNHAIS